MKLFVMAGRILNWIFFICSYGRDFARQARKSYQFLERRGKDGKPLSGAEKSEAFDERIKQVIVQQANYLPKIRELNRIRKATWGRENLGKKWKGKENK